MTRGKDDPGSRQSKAPTFERRRFLKQAGWVGTSMLAAGAWSRAAAGQTADAGAPADTGPSWIYAYPSVATVIQGGSLRLHFETNQPFFRVNLHRQGATPLVFTSGWFASGAGEVPTTQFGPTNSGGGVTIDWQWPYVDIAIDPSWPPGVYIVALDTSTTPQGDDGTVTPSPPGVPGQDSASAYATYAQALFVLRPSTPTAAILYKVNLNTFHAYSNGPGASPQVSFYANQTVGVAPDGDGGTHQGYRVTLLRPGGGTGGVVAINPDAFDPTDEQGTPLNTFAHWDVHLIEWLEQNGIAVDYCTDVDLHEQPALLSSYRLLMSGGHDEYWSEEMRDHVDAFVAGGGNVAFLTGNTCYWRVYFADDNGDGHVDAMVCDKREPDGSYTGGDGADVWWRQRPENSTTGVSTRVGGWLYATADDSYGYTLQNTSQWVFEGMNVSDGDALGATDQARLVHYEFDGVDYEAGPTGTMVPTGLDRTPASFVLLGYCVVPAAAVGGGHGDREPDLDPRFAATMGYFTNAGTVFNAATTEWPRALVLDPSIATMTLNVITGLSAARGVVALADLNGDGKEDLVYSVPFANGTAVGVWTLDGGAVLSSAYLSRAQVPGWKPVAVADFDGNGTKDVLFYDGATGQMVIWYLGGPTGTAVISGQFVTAPLDPPGAPVAAIDFDGDGKPDLLFWNEATLQASVWFMDTQSRTTFDGPVLVDQVAQAGMVLVGARDFNADGKVDLVFFDASTGEVTVWLMGGANGATFVSAQTIDKAQAPGWLLAGVGDINGDQIPELIFQSSTTGQLVAWLLSGNPALHFVEQVPLAAAPAPAAPPCGPTFAPWVFQPAGGTLGGDYTTLASMANAQVASFGRGVDGVIYFNVHTSSALWQGWTLLSGVSVSQGDRVAVTSYADGRLVAFVRASDGSVWFNVQSAADPRQWGGWSVISGLTMDSGDAVSATCASDGRLVIVARQSGAAGATSPHAINWESAPGSGTWTGWITQPMGGTSAADTSTIAPLANGEVRTFARGTDGAIWTNTHSPESSWQEWDPWPGVYVTEGDLVAVAVGPGGTLVAAVRDSSGQVAISTPGGDANEDGSIWSVVPGVSLAAGDPIALLVDPSGNTTLGVRGDDDGLLHCNQQPAQGAWCGWGSVAGLQAIPGDGFRAVLTSDGKIVFANRQGLAPATAAPGAIAWQT